MDGLLIIDKPAGPTSHDVVARMRRVLRERRIGHTGTLDPLATGVLPLVLGRATRLAKFMSASDKSYLAVVRLGAATDTGDAQGTPVGPVSPGPWPSRDAIDAALDAFRGTFLQQPPAFSAKFIDGIRSYTLARQARRSDRGRTRVGPGSDPVAVSASLPAPTQVTVGLLEITSVDADRVSLRLECSAGFYVRALAQDLGARLGVGAHLVALRRTRSGDFSLDAAIALDTAERDPAATLRHVIPPADMLPHLARVVLTPEGVRHARNGRNLGPADLEKRDGDFFQRRSPEKIPVPVLIRLLDSGGDLVGIAEPMAALGLLHPSLILG
ncbi:MAG: tRNA pseudouridine(55) synthase TruB [Acidobacteria bacterium]|nr:tRNA pseudouridine(55) synthase TruB [Acidobacteriota bacterium]